MIKKKTILLIIIFLISFGTIFCQHSYHPIPDSSLFKIVVDTTNKNKILFNIDHIEKSMGMWDAFDKMDILLSKNEILVCIFSDTSDTEYGTRIIIKSGIVFLAEISFRTKERGTEKIDSIKIELSPLGLGPSQDFSTIKIYSKKFTIDSILEISKKEFEEILPISYEERLEADTIYGVYIPVDINDCINQLVTLWSDSVKNEHKSMSEEDFIAQSHFGIGRSLRNNWGLWKGSRLSKYFNDIGISHPDYMSGTILRNYHRYLNELNIDLKVDEVLFEPDTIITY